MFKRLNFIFLFAFVSTLLFITECKGTLEKTGVKGLDRIAFEYVKLCLRIDKHHKGYVDSYIGDEKVKMEIDEEEKVSLSELEKKSENLLIELSKVKDKTNRSIFLEKQITAVNTFVKILSGIKFSFFEEVKLLYDIETELEPEENYMKAIQKIDGLLLGKGNALEKLEKYRKLFVLKKEEILPSIESALDEVKRRTKEFLPLPPDEYVRIDLVTKKPWSGYNWFKGNYFSLIEINIDLPRRVDQILSYMAHEGYPGHHTELCLKEKFLFKDKNYIEYSVYPLYSPESVISEGIAEFGLEIIFTESELLDFLKMEMFPMVGIKNININKWNEIRKSLKELSSVSGNAAILLLDKNKSEFEIIEYLQKYGLQDEATAKKQVEFIKTYRGYIFSYYYGYKILKEYVEKGKPKDLFKDIILQQVYPSYFE